MIVLNRLNMGRITTYGHLHLLYHNLPSWMPMKQPYFMVPLLILDPISPGNDIDEYLRPLVDELKKY